MSRKSVKSVSVALAVLSSAAAIAAAQTVRVVPQTGFVVGGVPGTAGQGVVRGGLNEPSTPLSFNPSLSLSLTPSVVPAPSAAQTVAAPSAVSVDVANAPLALRASAVAPAASKADDIRKEAAEAVAAWRAGRNVGAAKSGPALPTPSAAAQIERLDALFDGAVPTSREVRERAANLGLSDAALGLAIQESATPVEAAANLSALGVLGKQEALFLPGHADEFRFLLTRLWREGAKELPAPFPVDDNWEIPALKVSRDGVTYYVHAVAHGQNIAPRRGAVLRTAKSVVENGGALYSEQNLPLYYGYAAGKETLDHKAPTGHPVTIVDAAPGYTPALLKLKRAIDLVALPLTAAVSFLALIWVLLTPGSEAAWKTLIDYAGLPALRMRRRRRAKLARRDGLEDVAAQYADEAKNFFVSKPDLETLRGMELPQPLGGQEQDPYSIRSRAIAGAVAADAAATGATDVHLIVGHLHAHEVAWRLANGPKQTVPGSQKA